MKLAIFELESLLNAASSKWQDECLSQAFALVIGIEEPIASRVSYKTSTDIGIFLEIFEKNMKRQPSAGEAGNTKRTLVQMLGQKPENFKPLPGALKIFEACQKAGWKIAITLGSWKEVGELKLEASGLPYEFICGIGFSAADSIEREKAIRRAWDESKAFCKVAEFEKTVLVGSQPWDLKAAATLNLPFIAVASDSLKASVPDYSDVSAFVQALESAAVAKL